MNRRGSAQDYAQKVAEIREIFPDAGIFADIIVGYPTENEDDFKKSLNFIKKTFTFGFVMSLVIPQGGVRFQLNLNP